MEGDKYNLLVTFDVCCFGFLLCVVVCRLVDLDPEPELRLEGGGHGGPTSGRSHGDLTRLRSSSLEIREKEIREKGSEILREQLDAAKKVW